MIKNIYKIVALLSFITLLALLLMSFFSPKLTPKDYQHNEPKLDIRQYLNGHVKAWGVLEDRQGRITRSFVVNMVGTWQGNQGTLQEDFIFNDGEKSQRIWHITFHNEHEFSATAEDVIGKAQGSQYGNAVQMEYVLDLVVDRASNKRYHVTLDDWMYLMEDDIVVNKSSIKKFGITFAKLSIFFQKVKQ